MKYSEIVIMLGNKCTAECKICCINSTYKCNQKNDFFRLKEFVLSSKDVEEIKVINFSGGEVFLYFNELVELIKCCKSINKTPTIITNGYWAYKYQIAQQKLSILREAGLINIGISYDEFHAEYINIKNIRNIIKSAKSLDMKVSIQSAITVNSSISKWVDFLGQDLVDVTLNFISCDQVGRAKEMINNNMFIRNTMPEGCICRKGGTFSIFYDGNVWPCCAPYVTTTNLCIGNIYNNIHTVNDALDKLQSNIFLKILRNKGFDYFIKTVVDKDLFDIPDKVISACELCSIIFNNEKIKRIYPFIIQNLINDSQNVRLKKIEL
jgi:MoaA/NifB/PqqE/SkfB family radical SAM enzyme